MKVNRKDDIPYIMENKKSCLKPPTRIVLANMLSFFVEALMFHDGLKRFGVVRVFAVVLVQIPSSERNPDRT